MKKVLMLFCALSLISLQSFTQKYENAQNSKKEQTKNTEEKKYKGPVFDGNSKKYTTCDIVKNLPLEVEIGTSEGKNLIYISDYGRAEIVKTNYGYESIFKNLKIENKGKNIIVSANVTMLDMSHVYGEERFKFGEFYHSASAFLHSHAHPNFEKNSIKVGKDEFEIVEKYNDNRGNVLYEEKEGKFTFLKTNHWKKSDTGHFKNLIREVPHLVEFRFTSELCPVK